MRASQLLLAAIAALGAAPAAACTVGTLGPAFGSYDSLNTLPADAVGQLVFECEVPTTATVALSAGNGGSYAPRQMLGGAARLDYNLYTDPTRLVVWGDGTRGTATVTLQGGAALTDGRRVTRPIYARMPARQRVPPGAYLDSVFVTISF